MTEEQIKQNAEDYINENTQGVVIDANVRNFLLDVYLACAHSRDEEIKELELSLEAAADVVKILSNPWISVEERLPDREETLTRFSKDVLCALDNGEFYITDYFDYERNRWNSFPDSVTHWMPIHELEKGE